MFHLLFVLYSLFLGWRYIYCISILRVFRYNTQSLIEKPYLHIIGHSQNTIKDQLLYIKERIAELQSCTPIEFNGRLYDDKPRFFSGE